MDCTIFLPINWWTLRVITDRQLKQTSMPLSRAYAASIFEAIFFQNETQANSLKR